VTPPDCPSPLRCRHDSVLHQCSTGLPHLDFFPLHVAFPPFLTNPLSPPALLFMFSQPTGCFSRWPNSPALLIFPPTSSLIGSLRPHLPKPFSLLTWERLFLRFCPKVGGMPFTSSTLLCPFMFVHFLFRLFGVDNVVNWAAPLFVIPTTRLFACCANVRDSHLPSRWLGFSLLGFGGSFWSGDYYRLCVLTPEHLRSSRDLFFRHVFLSLFSTNPVEYFFFPSLIMKFLTPFLYLFTSSAPLAFD